MPTVLPNIGLTLPTRGPSGSGTWDDTIDADLGLLDAHNHSSGLGVRVPVSGLNINADIPFSSLYAPTQLHRLQFSSIASAGLTGSNNKSLFVSDGTSGLTANELYWRNNTGTHVKLTSGNALNVAAFVGGIGGDYSSVSAALNYDDSAHRYTFRTGGGTNWARLASGELRLFETDSADSVYVGQLAPAALAVSYQVTWPLALPASKLFVTMDATGAIATSVTSETFSHNMNLGVLSGGASSKVIGNLGTTSASRIALNTDTSPQILPLVVPIGTLTAFSVILNKNSAAGTITAKLVEGAVAAGTGTAAQVGSTQSNSANAPGNISLAQTGLTFAMTAGREYWIEVVGGGNTGDIITGYSATISVSPP